MDVYLRYYDATTAFSYWSVSVTFYCAAVPDAPLAPTARIATVDRIIVDWAVPANNGGSAVLGYILQMKEGADAF